MKTSSVSSESAGSMASPTISSPGSLVVWHLRRLFNIVTVCWSSQNSASRLGVLGSCAIFACFVEDFFEAPADVGVEVEAAAVEAAEAAAPKSNCETGSREVADFGAVKSK